MLKAHQDGIRRAVSLNKQKPVINTGLSVTPLAGHLILIFKEKARGIIRVSCAHINFLIRYFIKIHSVLLFTVLSALISTHVN